MTVPSLLILGTDAVLAAAPATPVQLAHACLAAGYGAVIPASWGDELIAARLLERLRTADTPRLQCCCPHVARRLAANGDAIEAMMLSCVAPPVATATYLRAVYAGAPLHLTFAGACPSASHESIDVWLSTDELLRALADRGIAPQSQPTEFDSVLPPDRRRFYSEPGGVPSRAALRHLAEPVDFVELRGGDLVVDLAQQLLASARTLVDVATALGCSCSGAVGGGTVAPEGVRARVREQEPPRALSPVVDHSMVIALDSARLMAPASDTTAAQVVAKLAPPLVSLPAEIAPGPSPMALEAPRHRSSPGLTRPVLGTMPQKRTESGRQLPRAYVARRRSSPRGLRAMAIGGHEPKTASRKTPPTQWFLIGGIGVVAGLGLAWLLRLAF